MSILKTTLVLATALSNHVAQLLVINLAFSIFFCVSLSLRPYNMTNKNYFLKNAVLYLMSVWFMTLIIFIGRFIENDDELSETEELIFEGFLPDEYFHYDMG